MPKDVSLFKGGTPDRGNFIHCLGQPQYFHPPFGTPRFKETPLGNAPYDDACPKAVFTASEVLFPARFETQMNAFLDSQPGVGQIIQLVIVPCNHYLLGVRFDIVEPDPMMAGATVSIAGQLVEEALTEPFDDYTITEDTEFTTAATAQGLSAIPLDERSTNILWLGKASTGAVSGTADLGSGAVTGSASGSYVIPYYVPPAVRTTTAGEVVLLEGGGLLVGLKIESLPTDTNVNIWDMQNPMYMSTIITAFNFKSNT